MMDRHVVWKMSGKTVKEKNSMGGMASGEVNRKAVKKDGDKKTRKINK